MQFRNTGLDKRATDAAEKAKPRLALGDQVSAFVVCDHAMGVLQKEIGNDS
jgi:hypothetical protein